MPISNPIRRLGLRLMNATAVPATFKHLMDEGLDRHEAIHAVGSVLMGVVFDVIRKVENER
jgi:hypothetical protein